MENQITIDQNGLIKALAIAFPEVKIADVLKDNQLKFHTNAVSKEQFSNLATIAKFYSVEVEMYRSAAKVCVVLTAAEQKHDPANELIAIRCLSLLFFNYRSEMLEEMLEIREFKHCWDNYLDESKQTYLQIWEFYLLKVSYKTQRKILAIAKKYYLAEATDSYEAAMDMEVMLANHVKKHQSQQRGAGNA